MLKITKPVSTRIDELARKHGWNDVVKQDIMLVLWPLFEKDNEIAKLNAIIKRQAEDIKDYRRHLQTALHINKDL